MTCLYSMQSLCYLPSMSDVRRCRIVLWLVRGGGLRAKLLTSELVQVLFKCCRVARVCLREEIAATFL